MKTISLAAGSMSATLCVPSLSEGIYRGTRFDHSGIFQSVDFEGHSYVSPWYDSYDAYCHDAVCGPSEEFSQIGYDCKEKDSTFLKIGVGVLRSIAKEYDRFHLYDVIDFGKRSLTIKRDEALFGQELSFEDYSYCYFKKISIFENGTFTIEHTLKNTGSKVLSFDFYNHNFFVLDGAQTGVATRFSFPFTTFGTWRTLYDSVHLTDNGIEFLRDLQKGETVFMGDLRAREELDGYSFRLENLQRKLSVEVSSQSKMDFAVFWSNYRVSCLEPYTHFDIVPRSSASWTILYRLGLHH
ncbi:MAG: hypothetical protein KBS95_00455 [Alistipes sp.]|nr:hypothetical protein [Candidatus Alistipes equi]